MKPLLLPLLVLCGCLAAAGEPGQRNEAWSVEGAVGRAWRVLGTSRERTGTSIGLEWSRPGRFAALRGRRDIETRETLAVRYLVSDTLGRDTSRVHGFWLSAGARWVGRGTAFTNLYLEAGTGFFYANGTTLDLNSRFNFANYIGFGTYFNQSPSSPRIGVRLIHISNGGVNPPNRGFNLFQLTFGVRI